MLLANSESSSQIQKNSLNLLPAAEAGGPGPLKIVAAEMAGDVNNFADEI